MKRAALVTLIVGTIAFDLFVIWAVGLTLTWGGRVPPLNDVGFWLFAVSSVAVTAYCIHKVRRFRRGESPRI